jgi:hypothetical protein
MTFVWPTSQCLGRQPCGLQADGHQAPCLTGCRNQPRWKDGPNERAIDRQELRRSFGNYIINDTAPTVEIGEGLQLVNRVGTCGGENGPGILTPFRRAMNAGDPYGTVNMFPNSSLQRKPSNQVQTSTRAANQAASSTASSGLRTTQGGSAYTGNPKKVYDSSDYIRYRRLQAKNRNYNDPTFGGDNNFAAQVALSRVRH